MGIVTTADGTVVNRELLAYGMAWVYTAYCKVSLCQEWKQVEQQARQVKVGLWGGKSRSPLGVEKKL